MNERIKTLIEQADIKFEAHPQHQGIDTAVVIQSDLEKFAELIVRQMLDITDAHTEVFQTDRDQALIEHIKQSVKQHFGVEL